MNKILTILKTGIICAFIISIIQCLTYWFFAEKFEEFYKYSPFLIIVLKIGVINFIVYLFFSILIFNFFSYLSGNFISKSFILMVFFVVFKTTPVILNLFLPFWMNLSFVMIYLIMNILCDVISAFIFTGMFAEAIKSYNNLTGKI